MRYAVFEGVSGEKIQAMLQFTELSEKICFTTLCHISIDLPEILVLYLHLSTMPMSTPG